MHITLSFNTRYYTWAIKSMNKGKNKIWELSMLNKPSICHLSHCKSWKVDMVKHQIS